MYIKFPRLITYSSLNPHLLKIFKKFDKLERRIIEKFIIIKRTRIGHYITKQLVEL